MASSIETHPQKQKIIDALISGESCESISKWCNPYISSVGIWRYKRKVFDAVAKAQGGVVQALEEKGVIPAGSTNELVAQEAVKDVTRASLQAQPIIARMEARRLERAEILAEVRKKGDIKAWAAVDRNDISATELEARLTGALSDGPRDSASVRLVVLPVISAPAGPMPCIPSRDVTFRAIEAGEDKPDSE